eukprot:scaffold14471_cov113-Isochrysis_galbana.AAC.9
MASSRFSLETLYTSMSLSFRLYQPLPTSRRLSRIALRMAPVHPSRRCTAAPSVARACASVNS